MTPCPSHKHRQYDSPPLAGRRYGKPPLAKVHVTPYTRISVQQFIVMG